MVTRNRVRIVRAQTEAVTGVYSAMFVKEAAAPVRPVRDIDEPGVLESVYEILFVQSR